MVDDTQSTQKKVRARPRETVAHVFFSTERARDVDRGELFAVETAFYDVPLKAPTSLILVVAAREIIA